MIMPTHPAPPTLRDPARAANASIRGYYYQVLHTGLAWLKLGPSDALWCEGNEDIEISLGDLTVEEQVKHLANKVSGASKPVWKSALRFLSAYVHHHRQGHALRLSFRTTAAVVESRNGALDDWLFQRDFDSARWDTALAELAKRGNPSAITDITYLRAHELEADFYYSVSWCFGQADWAEVERQLTRKIQDSDRFNGVDPGSVRDSIVRRIIGASSEDYLRDRALTSLDMDIVINDALVSKECERYRYQSNWAPEVFLAGTDRDGIFCACALRFQDPDHACASLTTILMNAAVRPNPIREPAEALLSQYYLDSVGRVDFDAYLMFGRVPAARRRAVKFRWLSLRAVRNASATTRLSRIHTTSFVSRQQLARFVEKTDHVLAGTTDDPRILLAEVLAGEVIRINGGESSGLFSQCQRKLRSVGDYDAKEYFTQERPFGPKASIP